jgi:hypothetical protein
VILIEHANNVRLLLLFYLLGGRLSEIVDVSLLDLLWMR